MATKKETELWARRMPPMWDLIALLLGMPEARVLLWGPPGVGKSWAATHYRPAGLEDPMLHVITVTEDTPAAELRGHYLMKPGGMAWHDGPGTRAWRTGGRLVLNELPRAGLDLAVLLHVLLDGRDVASLTLPSGETVQPAQGYSVVATCNDDPADALDPALLDRFDVVLNVTAPNPSAFDKLPEPWRAAARLHATRDPKGFSLRPFFALHRMIVGGLEPHIAVRSAMRQKEVADEILRGVTVALAGDGAAVNG